ncbi:hypothetical protein AWR36_010855 [Microbulbifer flavimaris]|uniref:Uncharacterized protein n=1 Tax=Microbulbifer flavimaris TaxID=1781068 RepID=A0ABX4HYN3_9GAMM|nr:MULTISPECIES: hypothetical protein [Microbulbifer]KUJ83030.1 hypothetical protein AVO43_10835 [Microbulbifer sp. ZGT114]PCO05214.1 hypothetical protein AWR36_010855 [Microbulbifer flavimaris]
MQIDYPLPQPHGEIRRLLPDLFYVPGTARLGPALTVNRNMAILRFGDELVLVNPVRLRPFQEEKLEDLGRVTHAVRLGYYHGCDDLYYRDRYNLTFWRQLDSDLYPAPAPDAPLREGGECPAPTGQFFEFTHSCHPEAALWVPMNGGLLLTCDALQYWQSWQGCTWLGRNLMRLAGFRRGMQVAPTWRLRMTPRGCDPGRWLGEDFERLLDLPFVHLLGGHGGFCADTAHEKAEQAVRKSFPGLH